MMTNRPYCCGNCQNYFDSGDMQSGQCRKNAPASGTPKKWPEVYYLDACSEHPSAPMTRQEHLLALIAKTPGIHHHARPFWPCASLIRPNDPKQQQAAPA